MTSPRASLANAVEAAGARAVVVAEAQWEKEGGAGEHGRTFMASPRADLPEHTARGVTLHGVTELDARRVQVMAATSTDGRPPPQWLRLGERRWFWIGALVFIAGIAVWVVYRDLHGHVVLSLAAATAVFLIGASPVLVPGVLRGRGEKKARAAARRERASDLVEAGARDPSEEWTK